LSTLKKTFKKVFNLKGINMTLLVISCVIAPFIFIKYSPAFTVNTDQMAIVDDTLINAIIEAESSGNPNAFNRRTGARGLTQIRLIAWQDLRKHYGSKYRNLDYYQDIFNPNIAREAGKDYLNILKKYLIAKGIPVTYKNLLTAYVWGPDNLYRHGSWRAPKEGKLYVAKVMSLSAVKD